MERLWQDVRFGVRMLVKRPGFTVAAVLCLGLGIGVNSAIFTLVNTVFLRPLPVREPERLVRMYTTLSKDFQYASVSYPDYVDYSKEKDIFSELAAHRVAPVSLTLGENPRLVVGTIVSGNYFDMLGVKPAAGRFFEPAEPETENGEPVVVISNGLWQRSFAGDPSVLGSPVQINGHAFTVIGVTPADFSGLFFGLDPDLYAPINQQSTFGPGMSNKESRGSRYLVVTGRLRDGLTLEQAREAANLVGQRLQSEYPASNENARPLLVPESEANLPPQIRGAAIGFSGLAMGAVGFVLLIACADVSNLLMARASSRRREISVRLALGAGRIRLARQLLTESVLLSSLGGAAGLALAFAISRFLSNLTPPLPIPIHMDFSPDYRVLLFCGLATLGTGLLFGLAPAIRSIKLDLTPALRGHGLEANSGSRKLLGFGNLLVAGQMALSLTLLVGAGLFIRSLGNAQKIDPGFNPEQVLLGSVDPSLNGYNKTDGQVLYAKLLERLQAVPGVRRAALAEMVSFGLGNQQNGVSVAGYQPAPDENMSIDYNIVSPGYFQTLEIPVLEGRDFSVQDSAEGQPVVIIDEAFAARFFAGDDPIGKKITCRGERVVVGLVKNIKIGSLGEAPKPYLYLPFSQSYNAAMTVHLRTEGDPLQLARQLRAEVRSLDPNLAVEQIRTMVEQVSFSLYPARVGATLLGVFAVLAIALSAIGLYGVMTYWVSRRTQEIGIRIAVGANRRDVQRLVMSRGLKVTMLGLLAGIALALGLGRLLENFLYGVDAVDPFTFAVMAAILFATAMTACFAPARRALRIDPIRALKYE